VQVHQDGVAASQRGYQAGRGGLDQQPLRRQAGPCGFFLAGADQPGAAGGRDGRVPGQVRLVLFDYSGQQEYRWFQRRSD